jgi:hypothetical protein
MPFRDIAAMGPPGAARLYRLAPIGRGRRSTPGIWTSSQVEAARVLTVPPEPLDCGT